MGYHLTPECRSRPTELRYSCIKASAPVYERDFWGRNIKPSDEPDIFSPCIIKGISPTKSFDEEIIDRLKSRQLIAISPTSEPEAFDFEQDLIVGYDSEKVLWNILPDVPLDERPAFIQQVEDRLLRREHKTWRDEWPRLWKKIAVEECVQFLIYTIERYGFSYIPDKEATDLFDGLAYNYSLAQVFNLIHRAAKNFADFARQQRWPMKASRVVGQIRNNEAYYRSQGWDIFSFNWRPAFPRQSAISSVFFDTVLGVGDDYFFKAPKDLSIT